SELGGRRVWIIENGVATPRNVQTGIRTEQAVQITGGIAPGDSVITTGLQSIRGGQPVRATQVVASLDEASVERSNVF
ncbi:MAG: hypothetical protein AAGI08_13355, partial [Bacteroidota bacterium]